MTFYDIQSGDRRIDCGASVLEFRSYPLSTETAKKEKKVQHMDDQKISHTSLPVG